MIFIYNEEEEKLLSHKRPIAGSPGPSACRNVEFALGSHLLRQTRAGSGLWRGAVLGMRPCVTELVLCREELLKPGFMV